MHCNKPSIETQDIKDLQIDTLESVPDYFLTERDIVDHNTGNTIRSITRTPGAKVIPNGNLDNIVAIEPNNTAIVVPEGQVRACRVAQEGSVNKTLYADATHKAHFIALGKQSDLLMIQNSGFINIPKTHRYIIGIQYYVGNNGEPTTETTSQKLFIPISETKLAINMN